MTKKRLEIWKTPTAKRKLKEIYTYSLTRWGRATAVRYMADLEKAICDVAEGGKSPKKNLEFSKRFNCCLIRRHYLFFEIQGDKLIIATIFHTTQLVQDRMQEEMPSIHREIEELPEK